MREPRVGEKFAAENKKLIERTLDAAAAASYAGTATAGPHVPTPLDDAHRVVALQRERVERASPSHRRNDPVDTRPTWREVESVRRWGPAASIPTAPPIVQVTREQLAGAILELNRQLGERHLEDKATKAQRDRLTAQLAALEGRAG